MSRARLSLSLFPFKILQTSNTDKCFKNLKPTENSGKKNGTPFFFSIRYTPLHRPSLLQSVSTQQLFSSEIERKSHRTSNRQKEAGIKKKSAGRRSKAAGGRK